jgi:hypothetical protein
MKKIKLSQSDIEANPLLKKIGAVAGQVLEYSFVTSSETNTNESTTDEGGEGDGEDGEGGGGNHPGKKPGN